MDGEVYEPLGRGGPLVCKSCADEYRQELHEFLKTFFKGRLKDDRGRFLSSPPTA